MRRNRYTAACDVCRCAVKPAQGRIIRRPGGWDVRHDDCYPNLPDHLYVTVHSQTHVFRLILKAGVVVQTQPSFGYMLQWSHDRLSAYCEKRGWELVVDGQKETPA